MWNRIVAAARYLAHLLSKRTLSIPAATVFFLAVVMSGLSPTLTGYDAAAETALRKLAEEVGQRGSKLEQAITLESRVDTSWLTSAVLRSEWVTYRKAPQNSTQIVIRWDRLTLVVAGWVLAVVILASLPGLALPEGSRAPKDYPLQKETAENILTQETSLARQRAVALYSRSTVLLLGGILIAFSGVVVFYFSLPESNRPSVRSEQMEIVGVILGLLGNDPRGVPGQEPRAQRPVRAAETLLEKSPEQFVAVVKEILSPSSFKDLVSEHFAKTLRPIGILVFIEAIAWFLLRQYRAMMEDYKVFLRMYLRRINYLIALRLFREEPTPSPATLAFVGALFQEDLTGRLKKDETTENLEALKTIEPNPVFEMFRAVIEKLPIGGRSNKKEGKANGD